jgi:hypothetical protein
MAVTRAYGTLALRSRPDAGGNTEREGAERGHKQFAVHRVQCRGQPSTILFLHAILLPINSWSVGLWFGRRGGDAGRLLPTSGAATCDGKRLSDLGLPLLARPVPGQRAHRVRDHIGAIAKARSAIMDCIQNDTRTQTAASEPITSIIKTPRSIADFDFVGGPSTAHQDNVNSIGPR